MKLELLRNDILLQLPPFTEEITRTTHTGLDFATLQSQTYNPISGTVLQTSPFVSHVKVDDTVFFQIFAFTNAKERCYGDDNPDYDDYKPFQTYAWKENGVWYMIIRETALYFYIREYGYYSTIGKPKRGDFGFCEDIVPINNYTLARPIKKERFTNIKYLSPNKESFDGSAVNYYDNDDISSTGLFCVDIQKENHKPNEAIIFRSSNPNLKDGDVVQTLRHCDITIEEQLNHPILPEDFFIIETKNIISCIKQ